MSMYEKPVISVDAGMAEGVYAASGAADGCYTATAYIHQTPETGRGDYRIQVNGQHKADHTKEAQVLTISFNQNVTYVSGGAGLISGNGTPTLKLSFHITRIQQTTLDLAIWLLHQMQDFPLAA